MRPRAESISAATAFGEIALGESVEVVGIEPDPSGGLRVWLGHRSKRVYAIVDDPDSRAAIEQAWANKATRLLIPMPPANALGKEDT